MTRPLLGFGTAPILGRESRARSLAAIATALDLGVRHFDTARSYGWGEAEGLLGEALAGIPRPELVLVSKCGIVPVQRTRALGVAKAFARRLIALAPGLKGVVRRAASTQALQPARTYDLSTLQASLAASLRALRTDYLDVLLLHNFEPGREGLEPVVAWMRDLQRQGVIRRFGFSAGERLVEALDWLEARGLLEGALIQAPLSEDMLALPDRFRDQELFVHSAFRSHTTGAGTGGDLRAVAARLEAACNCSAIVCSMFSPEHIRANVAALA